jgi:phytanoyl-CoA hydroxylase
MVRYHGRFGGMWLDQVDASQEIERRQRDGRLDAEEARLAADWVRDGFVVLPGALPGETIDRLNDSLTAAIVSEDPRFLASVFGENAGEPIPLERRFLDMPSVKLVDAYYYLPEARSVLLSERVTKVLQMIFDQPPLLFQSLSFVKGSEQWLHQDAVYVKVDPPLHLAAVWVALEDVREGSGELQYAPGSHRIPDHPFSGRYKHWYQARDGQPAHQAWVDHIDRQIADRGLEVKSFRPRKGDAFIWHAQLAHGGKAIEDHALSRRSIVGHYCPVSSLPECLWADPTTPRGRAPRWPRRVGTAGKRNPSAKLSTDPNGLFVSSYYRGQALQRS